MPSPRSSRPGAGTSPSRPTWPRRSPASAATSSSRRSRPTRRCPPSGLAARDPGAGPRDAGRRRPDRGRDARPSSRPGTSRRSCSRARCPSTGDEQQPGGEPIGVTNPLSRDHSLLRRNLLGSLLDVVASTCATGRRTSRSSRSARATPDTGAEPREWWRLGFALVGAAEPAAWNRTARPYDLDDAKGILELLAAGWACPAVSYAAETRRGAVPPGTRRPGGRRRSPARAARRGAPADSRTPGSCGPPTGSSSRRSRSTGSPPGGRRRSAPTACPRFPEVERDLAIIVAETPSAVAVEALDPRARGRPAAWRAPVRHLPRGAARGRGEEPRVPASVRRRGPDAHEAEVETAVAGVVGALPTVGGRLRA